MSPRDQMSEQLYVLRAVLDSVTRHDADCDACDDLSRAGEDCDCGAPDDVSGADLHGAVLQHIRILQEQLTETK